MGAADAGEIGSSQASFFCFHKNLNHKHYLWSFLHLCVMACPQFKKWREMPTLLHFALSLDSKKRLQKDQQWYVAKKRLRNGR